MGWNSQGALNYFKDQDLRKEKEEERALERENALFALTLESMKARNKYRTGEKYTSAISANKTLRSNLMNADLTPEDLAFYEPILEDPFASKFVEDFIAERADQGLNITYSMIPSMLNVVSSDAPETEKIDFIERITGADLTGKEGKELYRKLATEIVSAPTEIQSTLLISPKPGMNINVKNRDAYNKEMVKKVEAQVMPMARTIRDNSLTERGRSDPEVQRLTRLIKQVEEGGSGAEAALRLLLETVQYDKNSFDELVRLYPMDFISWETNPFLSGIPELFPDLD
tara:strand:+ start:2197 stop:3054 length:858 start_codon:yes stop_codon:yes gene_type:complete